MYRLLLTFTLLFCLPLSVADAADEQLQAGAAKVNINPPKYPVSMVGSFQDRQATSAHDTLHARALVLQSGNTRVAFVVCDICLISREIFDNAKAIASRKTGIPTSHMLTSATHTHTAPAVTRLAQCKPSPEYVQFLTESIAQAIIKAESQLAPAQIAWTVVPEPGEVNNRRWYVKEGGIKPNPFGKTTDKVRMNPPRGSDLLIKPAGPTDPDISILSVQHTDGRPLALLANYSLHYVGGLPPNQVSADYFGEFARQIKQRLGGDETFVGIMSNGSSGDINNINFREPRPRAGVFERITAVAKVIADRTYQAVKSLKYRRDVSIAMEERTLDLGIRKPNADEVKYAKQLLDEAKNPEHLTTNEVYARETLNIDQGPASVNLKLQALRIGDLGIVAIPCEVFAEIGLEIKQKSPLKPTFVIALANGYNGYLPTPEQHLLQGYETWRSSWSYLEVDASVKITEQVLAMLKQLTDK
ncbi:neutral/alkaline non-lysosomal ceramidase N-terminal domain-containing protein [Gimesia panareensis]|uniref:Neutral/alkaline non-lysosomal ceramidase n=1 Tax=Gimesia panareensis TaxID=2527978 RepID=A0A518A8S9_9PLAN|nr:neutral/alkaline non-lysosomal ceramidase N-terminal domain-containing protein [Gimesia panareensis]QDT28272.1 Neutral/alkaline non-lysosomal ceramidase [Gimesia panareensis]QDU51143.1 Neutral/alkaline non-lysosomal ceramidase [Gimesia panareensis]QDV19011.1 Neutral/alkaline non-lysosomal ceramidase [Gimesia panareensis]